MVQLKDYESFHSMMATPSQAKKCIDSFVQHKGCVLFMPSSHRDDEIHLYNASHGMLHLVSYYALVLFSLTGISTLLRMTKIIDVQDYTESGGLSVWKEDKPITETKSIENTEVYARECVLNYVENHVKKYNLKDSNKNHQGGKISLKLQRRFEYNFRLCGGLNVIMLHLSSSECPDVLHLVEVYQFQNPILRFIGSNIFYALSSIFDRSNKKQKKQM